jgi:hypothetical protein
LGGGGSRDKVLPKNIRKNRDGNKGKVFLKTAKKIKGFSLIKCHIFTNCNA